MEQMRCECGGRIEVDKTLYDGLIVECLRCKSCGNISFKPDQMQKVMELKEFGKMIKSTRKIITVGHSIAITLPRKLKRIGVKAGDKVKVGLLDPKTITVEFLK